MRPCHFIQYIISNLWQESTNNLIFMNDEEKEVLRLSGTDDVQQREEENKMSQMVVDNGSAAPGEGDMQQLVAGSGGAALKDEEEEEKKPLMVVGNDGGAAPKEEAACHIENEELGQTALMVAACETENIQKLRTLLQNNLNITCDDDLSEEGKTALMYAVERNNLEAVKLLRKYFDQKMERMEVELTNYIFKGCAYLSSEVCSFIETGINVYDKKNNQSALLIAMSENIDSQIVHELLQFKGKIDMNATNGWGWNALRMGLWGIIREGLGFGTSGITEKKMIMLLDVPKRKLIKEIDVNHQDETDGTTVLMWSIELVRPGTLIERGKLIEKILAVPGIDVNLQDQVGWTALHRAVYDNHIAVKMLLADPGIDVNLQDHRGRTALHRAVYMNFKAKKMLLAAPGIDVNVKDKDGETAFSAAGLDF